MMKSSKILGITIPRETKSSILEKILKYIGHPSGFFHIVSLNPENLVIAFENEEFKKIVNTAQIKIIDGVGIVIAGKILSVETGERVAGVALMEKLIKVAEKRLRVLLIGGKANLALRLAACYQEKFPEAKFFGTIGIKNIRNPQKTEEAEIFSIVDRFKPHLVFVAFGSPDQELWLARHKDKFKGIVCMGVGQGFDVHGGIVKRAPVWIQKIGLEWFFRLINQPWRWRRQIKLIKFLWLVLKQKIIT